VEEPVFDASEAWLEARLPEDGLTVVVPHLVVGSSPDETDHALEQLVLRLLASHSIQDYVLWYYTPMALGFTRALTPRAVVYDCMDELASFAGAPSELPAREAELIARADLVFTAGESLHAAKRDRHGDVHCFPSGVDVAHFALARDPRPDPAAQRQIPRPRLGFFGVIDERMDLELLGALADLRPDWQFVLLGPVVKIDPETLPRRANIHYLGPKSYADLPTYVAGWDVGLLPFARNEATRYISPTKMPEYLAAGLPVVSTPIRDVVDPYGAQGLVRIAEEPTAFARACEQAMEENTAARLRRVDAFLTESSWDYTWTDMRELIDRAVRRNASRARPGGPAAPSAFDWLVVGAGFAGSVMAERLASELGQRVLVVDRRNHIGGNAYDHFDEAGLLVHKYGPHIFHTNCSDVWEYLSKFTAWRPYEHRVLASVDGQLLPFPINLDTVNLLYGLQLSAFELDEFFASVAEPRSPVRTSEDVVISKVGKDLYLKFFRNYTRKQWDLDPSELDASVTARVPTRNNRDARYFTDRYQAMPLHGYTRLFERILAHPNIKVLLNADYREIEGALPYERMIYTGPIDEFFDLQFGKLPYRSLEFRFETIDAPVFQPAPVINYPNEFPYTRVTEFKYLTGQEHPKTSVVYEYPRAEGDPYYPVPRPENGELYAEYKQLAAAEDTIFLGRLATYKYYNMDQVVAQALALFRRLRDGRATEEGHNGSTFSAAGAVGRAGVHGQPRS
jgi:UDP-galactopyranose mutase